VSKQVREEHTAKVIVLFLLAGLASGLMTTWLAYHAGSEWVFWSGVGLVFWGTLILSLTSARLIGWLQLRPPLNRCLVSALIVAGTLPLAFWTALEVTFLYSQLYKKLLPAQWQRRTTSPGDEGIYLGFVIAALLSAVLISLALRLLAQSWERRAFWLMLIASVATFPISIATSALFGRLYGHSVGWDSILLILGETLFGGVAGYWLLRARSAARSP
jgi:hypothetical protein